MGSTTTWVTHHEGETCEDTYRRTDGDELGYLIPANLIDDVEAAQERLDAAITAIANYITDHDIAEQPIDDSDEH